MTEAIEEETASSIENDENETNEMDEKTQEINNTNQDISDDMEGNSNEAAEEFEQAIIHEEELSYDERMTIDDFNIVMQMNSLQMAIGQEEEGQPPTHSYNLREHPTKCKQQVLLAVAQGDEMTGVTERGHYTTFHPKIHAHVMLTQMNIKDRLLAFRVKGNEAILKELQQLHHKKALLPVMKENLTYDEREKAL